MRRWEPQYYDYENAEAAPAHGAAETANGGGASLKDSLVCMVLLAVVIAFATGTYQMWQEAAVETGGQGVSTGKGAFYQPFEGRKVFRFLVLGADGKTQNGRSDTLILVEVHPRTHKVIALSIPRDSYVYIPGHGMDKINAAYRLGGPELTIQTVRKFLPTLPVAHYVECDFRGFQKMVDILGGVTIDVEKPMHYTDKSQKLFINLKEGRQTLHGYDAMCYVRFRSDAQADIGRTKRQQKFLRAALQQTMQVSTLPKTLALLNALRTYTETNLTTRQIADLARVLVRVRGEDFVAATLPGEPLEKNHRSYWEVSSDKCARLLDQLARDASTTAPTLPTSTEKPLLAVLNGCGESGAARKVAEKMEHQGFRVVRTGNAESFTYPRSEIRCSPGQDSLARRVRQTLKCGTIVHVDRPPKDVAVVVIIGHDLNQV